MKRVLVATALAVFGLAPAMSAACEYSDDSSASATPSVQLGSAPAPAATTATKVPASAVAKTLAPHALKQAAGKVKAPVPDQKLAVGTPN
ncbi:MAG: hypothetical protein E6H74_14210 [Betaproteobacteria bacterium]|nr:MAG: hypothetical protein E6H74_14210 [Betaproteobacteria bacterium]